MLSQHASLNANYDAVLKQANNANAELTRRIESDSKEVRICNIFLEIFIFCIVQNRRK